MKNKPHALVGVCGIGFGHAMRQTRVIQELINAGCRVSVFTFGLAVDYFENLFPGNVFSVWVPWVFTDHQGVRWSETLRQNALQFLPGYLQNKRAKKNLISRWGKPDFCITDYDPTAAWLAKKLGIPLITIDQQSKYLGFDFPKINGHSRLEERHRLSLFFPKADARLACSFFPINAPRDPQFHVDVIPPILDRFLLNISKIRTPDQPRNHVLVYLTPVLQWKVSNSAIQSLDSFISIFQKFPQERFLVYGLPGSFRHSFGNVNFCPIDRNGFLANLAQAKAVISTAGHNLISEALYLGIPLIVMPISTYDQQLCARVVNENQMGYSATRLDRNLLGDFLDRLGFFSERIRDFNQDVSRALIEVGDPLFMILEKISSILGWKLPNLEISRKNYYE